MIKKIVVMIMICVMILSSMPRTIVSASQTASIVDNIIGYILSSIGAGIFENILGKNAFVSVNSDEEMRLAIRDEVERALNSSDGVSDGIYVDQDNNYHFSDGFTSNIYGILDSWQLQNNVFVQTNFANYDNRFNSAYVNYAFVSNVNDCISSLNGQQYVMFTFSRNEGTYFDTETFIYYGGNLGDFICPNTSGVQLMGYYKSGNQTVRVNRYRIEQYYTFRNGTYSDVALEATNTYSELSPHLWSTDKSVYKFMGWTSIISGYQGVYSNYPIVFAKTVADGVNYFKGTGPSSGTIQYVNNYKNFKTVSQDVINNNNWTNIYNNYVNDVDNEITDNTDLDGLIEIMGTYTSSIVNAINNGNGEDIQNEIEKTNSWMRRIYNRIGIIYDLLASWAGSDGILVDGGSGGGSGSVDYTSLLSDINNQIIAIFNHDVLVQNENVAYLNTLSDAIGVLQDVNNLSNNKLQLILSELELLADSIGSDNDDIISSVNAIKNNLQNLANIVATHQDMLQINTSVNTITNEINDLSLLIQSIDDNTADEIDKLQSIYAYLVTINESIRNSGTGYKTMDIIDNLPDMTNNDYVNLDAKYQVVKGIMEDTVPLCFIFAVGGLVNALDTEPVTPSWTIPFRCEPIGVNESISIDLDDFVSVHDVYIACFMIAFILLLMYLTYLWVNVLSKFV